MKQDISSNGRLRQRRFQRNWRLQDVADQLGTSVHTVQRWERGSQHPSAYYRSKLCQLFGLSAADLGLAEMNGSAELSESESARTPLVGDDSPEDAIWTVPYARNPHFTGRDDLLDHLMQQLTGEGSDLAVSIRQVALTQAKIIKGLGGIGKTQIVVEYAYRARERGLYRHTFWIMAASEEALLTSFVAIADLLPPGSVPQETDQHQLVASVLHWLEHCPDPWLLLVDNADDLALVRAHLPLRGNGHILLTTRTSAVSSLATFLEVDNMSIAEGIQFLFRRAQREVDASSQDIDLARQIVVALAQFPLALDQAGAYLEETGCDFSTYLHLCQDHRRALLARRGGMVSSHPDSVATTWSLSFQQLEQTRPAAAQLLCLCAFLSPDHIPEELLVKGAAYWPAELQRAVTNPLAFNELFEDLLTFSLLKRFARDQMLSLHRLVQVVQLERMDAQEQYQWAERLICAVHAVFPANPEDATTWPQCLLYLEQAQACATLIEQHHLVLPEAAALLERIGIYLREHASYDLAEPLFQQALQIRVQQVEPHNPDIALCLNHLALLYLFWGKRERAEALFQQALELFTQYLGPYHLNTAECLQNLALLYAFQGKWEQAESLFRRALSIIRRHLGPEHEKIAFCLQNLAEVYRVQEKHALAEPLYQRALALWKRLWGLEHPRAIKSLAGLADLYTVQGKYAEAESLYQQMLVIRQQQFGPEHPLEAYASTVLAHLYVLEEKYREAEHLYTHALQIWEKRPGPQHPNMADTFHGLATLYRNQGKYEQAAVLFRQALLIKEQMLDTTHPDLAKTWHEFAVLLQAQSREEEACTFYKRALIARNQTLGANHPLTVQTRERLKTLQQQIGQVEKEAAIKA
jgi:tetratricopeptide (TPR) repeat protein/transcriptional regulator with XRE-family HTH domain